MKRQKFNTLGVKACPFCWWRQKPLTGEEKKDKWARRVCLQCNKEFLLTDLIHFDSCIEWEAGYKLKTNEKAGKIKDLKHHSRFELINLCLAKWPLKTDLICFWDKMIPVGKGSDIICFHDREFAIKPIKLPIPFSHYEADFSFTIDGKIKVIEVKGLDYRTQKPHFKGNKTTFAWQCRLMKIVHGIDIEVWAGGRVWKWDSNFKKLEVVK